MFRGCYHNKCHNIVTTRLVNLWLTLGSQLRGGADLARNAGARSRSLVWIGDRWLIGHHETLTFGKIRVINLGKFRVPLL